MVWILSKLITSVSHLNYFTSSIYLCKRLYGPFKGVLLFFESVTHNFGEFFEQIQKNYILDNNEIKKLNNKLIELELYQENRVSDLKEQINELKKIILH